MRNFPSPLHSRRKRKRPRRTSRRFQQRAAENATRRRRDGQHGENGLSTRPEVEHVFQSSGLPRPLPTLDFQSGVLRGSSTVAILLIAFQTAASRSVPSGRRKVQTASRFLQQRRGERASSCSRCQTTLPSTIIRLDRVFLRRGAPRLPRDVVAPASIPNQSKAAATGGGRNRRKRSSLAVWRERQSVAVGSKSAWCDDVS